MTNETMNTTELVDNFVAQMTEQATVVSGKLKAIDEAYKNDRAGLAAQLAQINRTLTALKAKATTQQGMTFRKPMSEQGKANIAAALKARRDRLAAEAKGEAVAETAVVPSEASEEQSEPLETTKPTAAKKSVKKVTHA